VSYPNISGTSLAYGKIDEPRGGLRIPHWHSNAGELTYFLEGKGRVTVLNDEGEWETFLVREGDLFWSPEGYYHYFENVGDDTMTVLAVFNTPTLKTFDITAVLDGVPDRILAQTFKVKEDHFDGIFTKQKTIDKPDQGSAKWEFDPKSLTTNKKVLDFKATLRGDNEKVKFSRAREAKTTITYSGERE